MKNYIYTIKKAHIQSYTMEAVAFFDKLNFDLPNNDECEIDHIEESVSSVTN